MNVLNEDLMKPIEKIVRPIKASISHKQRMREELYSHLQLIHQEEVQRTEDHATALKCSVQRLGNPEELRKQLQKTISKPEKFFAVYNSLFARGESESRLRFATRMGVGLGVLQAVFYALCVLICSILVSDESIVQITPLLMVISALMGWNGFWGVYLSQSDIELQAYLQPRQSNIVRNGFLFGLSIGFSEILMWLSIPGVYANMMITLPQFVFPALAGWAMYCLVVWFAKLERDQTAYWELIQLED